MSADNGIYILATPTEDAGDLEYRVRHAQAIENIYWDEESGSLIYDRINPTQLVAYFGECEVLSQEEAHKKAFELEEEILNDDFCPVLEYGINTIVAEKPFSYYVKNAVEEEEDDDELLS